MREEGGILVAARMRREIASDKDRHSCRALGQLRRDENEHLPWEVHIPEGAPSIPALGGHRAQEVVPSAAACIAEPGERGPAGDRRLIEGRGGIRLQALGWGGTFGVVVGDAAGGAAGDVAGDVAGDAGRHTARDGGAAAAAVGASRACRLSMSRSWYGFGRRAASSAAEGRRMSLCGICREEGRRRRCWRRRPPAGNWPMGLHVHGDGAVVLDRKDSDSRPWLVWRTSGTRGENQHLLWFLGPKELAHFKRHPGRGARIANASNKG